MGGTFDSTLKIDAFAGLRRRNGDVEIVGDALAISDLPARKVRRFSDLEKGVIACVMGLGDIGDATLVFASRYGAMGNTLNLLKAIAEGETLSPTAFSLSVHNAAIGVASQMTSNRGAHTAVAAGPDTIAMALVECASRLHEGEERVVLVYTDCRLSGEYEPFNAYDDEIQFACVLSRAAGTDSTSAPPVELLSDPSALFDALSQNAEALAWTA